MVVGHASALQNSAYSASPDFSRKPQVSLERTAFLRFSLWIEHNISLPSAREAQDMVVFAEDPVRHERGA